MTRQKKRNSFFKTQKAFTLLELIIGVAIVAVMASIAWPAYSKYVKDAYRSEAVRMLLTTLRAQQEVSTQWAARGGDASNLMHPSVSSNDFCQNLRFTEFFHSTVAGVPTIDVRFPNTKYNLILGITSKSCWEESVQQASITELSKLPGYDELTPKLNDFGSNNTKNDFLMGAERNANGQLDVLFVNQDGELFLLCDQGTEMGAARDVYTGVTDGAPTCVVNDAETQEDPETAINEFSM